MSWRFNENVIKIYNAHGCYVTNYSEKKTTNVFVQQLKTNSRSLHSNADIFNSDVSQLSQHDVTAMSQLSLLLRAILTQS